MIALGVGALAAKKIGPRTTLFAEQEMLEAGAFDFQDTESFLATAESFLTPYVWGEYNLLLLPYVYQ